MLRRGKDIIRQVKAGSAAQQKLAIGSLTAISSSRGIVLALSSPLTGDVAGQPSYSIYRSISPDFAAGKSTLLATVEAMPHVDETAKTGVHYFYGVVGHDGDVESITAVPAGTESWNPDYIPSVMAMTRKRALNIIFAGDSITYGLGVRNAGTVKLPTMPGYCITALRRMLGLGEIYGSNQGHNSHTLTDYAPGGTDYHDAFARINPGSAASRLRALHPEADMVVSLMLGTNDSAIAGSNNGTTEGVLNARDYTAKLVAILDRLLEVDAPDARVVLHMPPYYTTNSRTNFTYGPAGLAALMTYGEAIERLVSKYAKTEPGKIFVGDMQAFEYFAQNYRTEHLPQRYRGSTFYLHPSGVPGSSGLIGTQSLGEFHATAIARVVSV